MPDPYRDESEALRARVRDLEAQLADAHAEIAAMTSLPAAPNRPASALFGTGLLLQSERVLDGEVSSEAFEVLVERLNERLGVIGRTDIVGKRFGYAVTDRRGAQGFEVSIHPQGGKTKLVLRERLQLLAGGLFGGIGGGVGLGAAPGIVAISLGLGLGLATPVVCLAWLVVVWLGVRTLFTRIAAAKQRRLASLSKEVVAVCAHHLPASSPDRQRVSVRPPIADARDEAAEAEAEADAELEAARAERIRAR